MMPLFALPLSRSGTQLLVDYCKNRPLFAGQAARRAKGSGAETAGTSMKQAA